MSSWDDLCGSCILSSICTDVRHPFDDSANGIVFELDGHGHEWTKTVFVFEDPSDGYRSSATEPMVCNAPLYSFGCNPEYIRVPVLVRRWVNQDDGFGHSADGIELVDTRNDQVILRVGTDNDDDYYPSYTAEWMPQNMMEPVR